MFAVAHGTIAILECFRILLTEPINELMGKIKNNVFCKKDSRKYIYFSLWHYRHISRSILNELPTLTYTLSSKTSNSYGLLNQNKFISILRYPCNFVLIIFEIYKISFEKSNIGMKFEYTKIY